MAYTVIRTDLMSGTKQPADLLHIMVVDAQGKPIEVENGTIVKIGDLMAIDADTGEYEREVYTATLAAATDDLDDCAIVAGVEVEYDERKRNLDEYVNAAGKIIRAYIPRSRNWFSVTKEGFVGATAPALKASVGIGEGGKIAAGSKGVGKCVAIEPDGRYTYYVIQVDKSKT